MIQEETIGDFRFQIQTIFYMYAPGNDRPIMITSSLKEFNRQKSLAESGDIKARNKTPQEPPSISYEEACSFDEKSTNESQKL